MRIFVYVFLFVFIPSTQAAEDAGVSSLSVDYRLHDIWVLTHIDNAALDPGLFENSRLGAPQFEFFVDDKILQGHTGCNQFSTSFSIIGTDRLETGIVMTTRMMCPQIEIENLLQKDFFGKVLNYDIADLQLTLSNESGGSISFKKID